ncbi:MAG TPA: response regulator [Kofleriaceae bacterium]|jgi:CheY-like chemotaxis protein
MTAPKEDVLIVDDDEDMAEVVKAVLDSEGYHCRYAANGRQALDEVATAMPAVVLLDMLMPVMNGWDCAHALRARYGRSLPIIVMTAAEHAEARRNDVGADGVLSKPFDLHELLRVVAVHHRPPSHRATAVSHAPDADDV